MRNYKSKTIYYDQNILLKISREGGNDATRSALQLHRGKSR